jgi:hypothetical protein
VAATRSPQYGGWLVLAILTAFLLFAFAFLYVGWGMVDSDALDRGQQMSTSGYVAMTFGIIVTLGLGIGLMALVFYSSRKGHDQDAALDNLKREK